MKKKETQGSQSHLYTPANLREIANSASVDPKTVKRYLDGFQVRPTGQARIIAALKAFGPVKSWTRIRSLPDRLDTNSWRALSLRAFMIITTHP